jgi:hypothetical protein
MKMVLFGLVMAETQLKFRLTTCMAKTKKTNNLITKEKQMDIIAQRERMRNRKKVLTEQVKTLLAQEEYDDYVVALAKGRVFELEEQYYELFGEDL